MMGMKAIELQLVIDPKKNEETAAQAYCQPQQVDSRESFMPKEISKSDGEIVSDHECQRVIDKNKKYSLFTNSPRSLQPSAGNMQGKDEGTLFFS
jgi:hypothetical protein